MIKKQGDITLAEIAIKGNKLNQELSKKGKIADKIAKIKKIIKLLTEIGNTNIIPKREKQLDILIENDKRIKNEILNADTGIKEINHKKISLFQDEEELLKKKLDALIEQRELEGVNVIGYWGDEISIMNEMRNDNPIAYIKLLNRNLEFSEKGITIEIFGGIYLVHKDKNNIELSLIDAERYAQDRGNEIVRFLNDLYYYIPKKYVDNLFKIDKHSYYHFDKDNYNQVINTKLYKPHEKAKFLTCKKIGEGKCSSETIVR